MTTIKAKDLRIGMNVISSSCDTLKNKAEFDISTIIEVETESDDTILVLYNGPIWVGYSPNDDLIISK